MDSLFVIGFLKVIGISLVPVGVVGALIHAGDLYEHTVVLGRRLHLIPPQAVPPAGPPLEKLAADLRRLRAEVRHPRPGITMARQRGVVSAYDGVLVSTARALGVPTTLADLPDGLDHEAERLRLEFALEDAGLSWQAQEH